MATATYRFIVPGRYIGQTVTVFDQATNAQVASGAVGSDGVYSVALTQGDYYATTPDGRYIDADSQGASDSDAASVIKAQQSATYAGQPGLTMALLGDSQTNQNSFTSANNVQYNGNLWVYTSGQGFWTWANAYLGQRFTQVKASEANWEFGDSGLTAAQILSGGHVDAVIAAKPAWCHYMAGTNDIFADGLDGPATFARNQTNVAKLIAAGIRVVVGTILPRQTQNANQATAVRVANKKMIDWAATQRNVVVNDWHMTLVDAATGNGKAVYFADGVHPFGAGASRMGYALAKVLEPITPKSDRQIGLSGLLGLTQPLQAGTAGVFGGGNAAGGSGQLATGVTCYVNTGVTVVASKVARTDLIPGEWQQLQMTSAATGAYNYTMRNSNAGVDWQAGDTVYAEVEYQTDAAAWNANQLSVTVRALPNDIRVDAAGNTSDTTLYQPVVSQGVMRTPNLVIPSGTAYVRVDVNCGGGTHTLRVGRMQLYKV